VAKEGGLGVAATLFVKNGDDFVRAATTLAKPNKTGRAIGTVLDTGPALDALTSGKAYNGEVSLFSKPYIASYEPITDASGAVLGAYFVGDVPGNTGGSRCTSPIGRRESQR
jgi:methyl-accepting chemotaxis protein